MRYPMVSRLSVSHMQRMDDLHTSYRKSVIDDERDTMVVSHLPTELIGDSHDAGTRTFERPTLAIAGISAKIQRGFEMTSTKIAFVFSSMAAAYASAVFSVTQRVLIPHFLNTTSNC